MLRTTAWAHASLLIDIIPSSLHVAVKSFASCRIYPRWGLRHWVLRR